MFAFSPLQSSPIALEGVGWCRMTLGNVSSSQMSCVLCNLTTQCLESESLLETRLKLGILDRPL